MLNKKSGLLGLSGVSSDMREILKAADDGNARALLALKAYCYRVRKYIGRYVAAMGGWTRSSSPAASAREATSCARWRSRAGVHGHPLDDERNRTARVRRGLPDLDGRFAGRRLDRPRRRERMMAREALRALSRSYLASVLEARTQSRSSSKSPRITST
jgi:acetate kinase